MLFLTMLDASKKLVLVTEPDMYDFCLKEEEARRVPVGIEFVRVEIPEPLHTRLDAAKAESSREVSPRSA